MSVRMRLRVLEFVGAVVVVASLVTDNQLLVGGVVVVGGRGRGCGRGQEAEQLKSEWRYWFDSLFVSGLERPHLGAKVLSAEDIIEELVFIANQTEVKGKGVLEEHEVRSVRFWWRGAGATPNYFNCNPTTEERIWRERLAVVGHKRRSSIYGDQVPLDVKLDELIEELRADLYEYCVRMFGNLLVTKLIAGLPVDSFASLYEALGGNASLALLEAGAAKSDSSSSSGLLERQMRDSLVHVFESSCTRASRLTLGLTQNASAFNKRYRERIKRPCRAVVEMRSTLGHIVGEYADYLNTYWLDRTGGVAREWLLARKLCRVALERHATLRDAVYRSLPKGSSFRS